MLIATTIQEIRDFIFWQKSMGKKIGFVPTMGALHKGHISLLQESKKHAEVNIVSIFVNKTQFNDAKDYEKYPRQVESDLALLKKNQVDCVFLPNAKEIFPNDFSFKIIPNALTNCLCAASRGTQHFEGVCIIVAKLFNIIKPDFAFFGEKDFQQLLVIKKLVRDLNFEIEIIACKTMREESGLAMSSRNQRLSKNAVKKAAKIFKILNEIKREPKLLKTKGEELLKNGFEKIDYLEIRDEKNLNLVKNFDKKTRARIFIAVYLEGVRLIDNMPL